MTIRRPDYGDEITAGFRDVGTATDGRTPKEIADELARQAMR